MSLTKEEMLELAKKCGANFCDCGNEYCHPEYKFTTIEALAAYTSAIEEKYQAQIVQYQHDFETSVSEHESCKKHADYLRDQLSTANATIAMLMKELKEVEVVRMHYEESSQVYFTCPSCEFNEGYAPEVVKHDPKCGLNNVLSATQATAEAFRAEVEARALEEAASVAYAWPDDQHAELELRCMAAEKRKQAEQLTNKEKEA